MLTGDNVSRGRYQAVIFATTIILAAAAGCGSGTSSSTLPACKTALRAVLADDRAVGKAGSDAAASMVLVVGSPSSAPLFKGQIGNTYDELAHALNTSDATIKKLTPQIRACGLS